MSPDRLKDKVAIITGGAQGIGRAYCLGMAREGAKIVIADINLEAAEKTAKEIKATGKEAIAVKTDVSNLESTEAMAKTAMERYGRIDILVNNAAVFQRPAMTRGPFFNITPDEWDKVMSVNLKGTFLCCRAVFPYMKAQKSGKIINTSSGTFFAGVPNQLHYVASKGGVIGLTRSLAREVGDYNINVNSIAPGGTQSYDPSEKDIYEAREKSLLNYTVPKRCLKRIQTVDDLVGTAIFLASADSDFITGETIVVDGGETVH